MFFFSAVDGVPVVGAPKDDDPKLNAGLGSSFFGSAAAELEPNEKAGFCVCDEAALEPLAPKENVELDAGTAVVGVVDEPKENGLGAVAAGAVEDDGVLVDVAVAAAAAFPPNENGVEDVVLPPKRDEPGVFCGAAVDDAPAPPNNDFDGAAELFREKEGAPAVLELEPKENGLEALLAAPLVASAFEPKPKFEEGVVAVVFGVGVFPKLNPPDEGLVAEFALDAEPKLNAGLLVLSLFALPKREFELEPDPKEKVLLPAVENIVSIFIYCIIRFDNPNETYTLLIISLVTVPLSLT